MEPCNVGARVQVKMLAGQPIPDGTLIYFGQECKLNMLAGQPIPDETLTNCRQGRRDY